MSDQLTQEQSAGLERMGPERVTLILATYAEGRTGPEGVIGGFYCGDIRRSPIEPWLAEKVAQKKAQEKADRLWLRIAAWAAIVSAIASLAGLFVSSSGPR
jgi:hypothetical protein